MKKWIIRIGIGVVILLVLTVGIVFLSLNSIVKRGVELIGPQVTKTDVKLGSAKLSPLSGSGELSDFSIGNPEGFSTNHSAIKVGSIKVAVKPASIFSDVIQVDEVNIQSPELTLEGKISGSNLGKLMDNLKGAGSSSGAPPVTQPAAGTKPQKNIFIKDLVVNGGTVGVSLTALGGKGVTVPLPPIHLQNIGTADKGITMAEASSRILQQVLNEALKASAQGATELGRGLKDTGTNAVNQAGKALDSLKGIFKK